VHLRASGAVLCQVALPGDARAPDAPRPTTLRALPASVDRADRWRLGPTADQAPIGIGGDDARELVVSLERSLLVAGPPGSGRTNALAVVAACGSAAGRRVVVVSPDRTGQGAGADRSGPDGAGFIRAGFVGAALVGGGFVEGGSDEAHRADAVRLDPSNLSDWLHEIHSREADSPEPATLLVVDDIDDLERDDPDLGELLARLVLQGAVQVAASSSAAAALGAYRGVLPAMMRCGQRLVLEASDAASADLVGPGSGWLTDHHRRPGRGVLVAGRVRDPVQVYRLPPGFLPDVVPGSARPAAPGC
jgi:DNA segregation ATPase FtsK/SpoIIIE, S-DNA-T family